MNTISEHYVTVHEFARRVQRPPSQIYNLITKGNQFRHLKAVEIEGKWMVPESEVTEFPFNLSDKTRIDLMPTLKALEVRVKELESRVKVPDCSSWHKNFSDKDDTCPICRKPLNPNF